MEMIFVQKYQYVDMVFIDIEFLSVVKKSATSSVVLIVFIWPCTKYNLLIKLYWLTDLVPPVNASRKLSYRIRYYVIM